MAYGYSEEKSTDNPHKKGGSHNPGNPHNYKLADDEKAHAHEKQSARDKALVQLWITKYLPAARKEKEDFQRAADEVDKYFTGNHDHLFHKLREWIDPEVPMTVNLAFQIRGYLGAHLYDRNPARIVTPTTNDTVMAFMCEVMQAYLNYTPNELGLEEEFKDGVDDALLPGRAVFQTLVDEATGMVTTRHVAVDDVLIDPDARTPKEALWVAVRRQETLRTVKDRFGKKTTKGLKANMVAESASDPQMDTGYSTDIDERDYRAPQTSEMLCYYEIWTKFGSGFAGLPKEAQEWRGYEDGDRFKRLVVASGHPRPLYEGEWDIPLYLDDDWTLGFMDFTGTRKGAKTKPLWPVSLMKAALAHQQAIDLGATILLEKLKVACRTVTAVPAKTDSVTKKQIMSGGLHEVVELDTNDGVYRLSDLIQRVDLGDVPSTLMDWIHWNESKFGEITGLLPIFKGSMAGGDEDRAMRSATEATVRDKNARSRVEDMNNVVEKAATRSGRREQIAIRTALTAKAVAKVVDGRIDDYPGKVKVIVGPKELAVPDLKDGGPFAFLARYFKTEEEAQQALQHFHQTLQAIQMQNPELPFVADARVVRVTIRDLWADTAGMSADDVAREFHCRIEAGTARRPDRQLLVDQSNMMMERVGQVALQFGDFAKYNEVLEVQYELAQIPKAQRIFLNAEAQQQQQQQQQQAQQEAQQEERSFKMEEKKLGVRGDLAKIAGKGQADIALATVKNQLDPVGGGGVR